MINIMMISKKKFDRSKHAINDWLVGIRQETAPQAPCTISPVAAASMGRWICAVDTKF